MQKYSVDVLSDEDNNLYCPSGYYIDAKNANLICRDIGVCNRDLIRKNLTKYCQNKSHCTVNNESLGNIGSDLMIDYNCVPNYKNYTYQPNGLIGADTSDIIADSKNNRVNNMTYIEPVNKPNEEDLLPMNSDCGCDPQPKLCPCDKTNFIKVKRTRGCPRPLKPVLHPADNLILQPKSKIVPEPVLHPADNLILQPKSKIVPEPVLHPADNLYRDLSNIVNRDIPLELSNLVNLGERDLNKLLTNTQLIERNIIKDVDTGIKDINYVFSNFNIVLFMCICLSILLLIIILIRSLSSSTNNNNLKIVDI